MLESPFFEELANKSDGMGIKIENVKVRVRQDRSPHRVFKQCFMMDLLRASRF